ncbi:MAG: YceH family protein [bacterium]
MNVVLDHVEARIIGCLIEKEITTPDYYPMTLNALTNACNQKSNRNPVVAFEETTVVRGLDALQEKGLTRKVHETGSRVPKYRHAFRETFDLPDREVAVLCTLMLRGPQTAGEIRTHTERMCSFGGLDEVEETLQGLMGGEVPSVVKLPRQAGRKERRYMHLLSGVPELTVEEMTLPPEAATVQVRTDNEKIPRLEQDVEELRREIEALRCGMDEFKAQFE